MRADWTVRQGFAAIHRSSTSINVLPPKAIDNMKRHQKPFSVEIKKSRIPDQRHHLPPRRLFAVVPQDETSALIQTESQAVVEPLATPRILPSIIKPVPGNPEPVEPVRRKRASKSKAERKQIGFDLYADADEEAGEGLGSTLVIPETGPQTEGNRCERPTFCRISFAFTLASMTLFAGGDCGRCRT
ncbi:hypothetical protein [Microvirga sp. Mcv34]|uniref:hypothetical protein n=1 Tax=Microvirga sp. Mcv34 TaxID=2926016 RepID=UPI0021C5CFC4|nr:hypothetical protein [Microvirga sp. Mcv34]